MYNVHNDNLSVQYSSVQMMMVARLLATLGQIYYIFRGQPSEKFVGCQTVLVTVLRILKSNIS